MNKSDIEIWYSELINDEGLDHLTNIANRPNIFRILKIESREIRHSNMLAWLMNPNGSHGLNDQFLFRFLQCLFLDERAKGVSILDIGDVANDTVEVRREWKNIDILIISSGYVICIENKVWSSESKHQLKKYKNIVDKAFPKHKRLYVYLNPSGEESSQNDIYINLSYLDIIEILESIIRKQGTRLDDSVFVYINDYLTTLKHKFMDENEAVQLAQKIYCNHKDLFDFVYEHKPDIYGSFSDILREKIKERSWPLGSQGSKLVRFLPSKIDELIVRYKRKNGWRHREAFLFEFDIRESGKLKFRTVLSPCGQERDYFEAINQIISEISEETNFNEKWKIHISRHLEWNLEQIMPDIDEQDIARLDIFFKEEVEPIVEKVTEKILDNKEILFKIKRQLFE
ncbi:MAG: PD-(D/E)XK nuclease family protein [Cyclobacteriaceae bacterium]